MPPKRTNWWVTHVKDYNSDHPGMTYKQSLKSARPCYHSTQYEEGLWDYAKGFLKKTQGADPRSKGISASRTSLLESVGWYREPWRWLSGAKRLRSSASSASHGRVNL
jgi:hypothetical protein